jgi:hypothetical protein
MLTNQRVQILRLLAVGWLSIVATGCLKSKMSEQNAVRTEGADARYLETVPVQTESGQPGLCLYSAQGSPSAAGSIDPSNTGGAEVISGHALYQGELIQGLETIPGIDAIREAVINDLVTPTAIIGSAALAAAGRFSSIGLKNIAAPQNAVSQANGPAPMTKPSPLLPSGEARDATRRATAVSSKIDGWESSSFEKTKRALEKTGFSFDREGTELATREFGKGPKDTRYGQWINQMEQFVTSNEGGNESVKTERLRILRESKAQELRLTQNRQAVNTFLARLQLNPTDDVVKESYKILPKFQPLQTAIAESADNAPKEAKNVRNAMRGIRLKIPEGFKRLCSNAQGSSWAKAGLCTAGVVAGVFGLGNLAMGFLGGSAADTDSIRTAIATDAASSPDVVIDGNSYAKLIEGLRQFSDRIAADPTIQSMRPTCQ